jgi:hypothetical protein
VTSIKYLFPPDKVNELPTWRFVLHFMAPADDPAAIAKAVADLRAATWKAVTFPFGLESLAYDAHTKSVDVAVEVPPNRRRKPGSLQDYESDFWKICGNMIGAGFGGDIYYEAVDWHE